MLLDDVRAYLVAHGVVSTGWQLFSGYLPDDQDQCIAISFSGGYPADTLGRENARPTFQLRVRAGRLDLATAYAKWEECFNFLQDAQAGSGLLTGYAYIQALSTAPMAFTDAKGRHNLTTHFKVMKSRT